MQKRNFVLTAIAAAVFLAGCEGDDGTNGMDGADGADGADGFNSLIKLTNLPVGDAVCLGGGTLVESGLDTNRNDVLDADEVQASEYIDCGVTPTLRALHASADAPAVDILVDGAEALLSVPFPAGSGFLPVGQAENVTEGEGVSVNVVVNALLPGDAEAVALSADIDLAFDTETTVIASGDVQDGLPLTPIVIGNPLGEDITDGFFRVQVVHGADDAPPVDVYVTAPGGDLVSPVNGDTPLAYGGFTPQLEVLEGTYQIRIAVPGEPPVVVFDSGSDGIELAAGADLMIVAVDNAFIGESPVELVVLDGTASSSIKDAGIGAAALAVHLSPDAGAVDILADAAATAEDDALKLVDNASYTGFCVAGENIAPDTYTLSVVATGGSESVFDFEYEANAAEATALVVTGLAGSQALQDIQLPVPTRFIATESRIRLTHSSPSTPNVDIYVLETGGDIGTATPDYEDVPFGASTPLISLAPNVYDIYVTVTGSKDPAISVTEFPLAAGDNYDIFARDGFGEEVGPQVLPVKYDENLTLCIPEG